MNDHGLSRHIPHEVKKEVRVRCGFGCVVCGAIPYDYDHFHVPFAEAKEHLADDIILLCDTHHRMKGAGAIDNEFIGRCMQVAPLDRESHFRQPGVNPDFGVKWPSITLEANFQGIVIDGEAVFHLQHQDDELEPVLLSGALSGRDGRPVCRIENNVIITKSTDIGDLTVVSNRFSFTSLAGQPVLNFSLSNRGLEIDEIYFVRKGIGIFANAQRFLNVAGAFVGDFTGATLVGNDIAIEGFGGPEIDYTGIDVMGLIPTTVSNGTFSGNRVGIGVGWAP